MLVGAYVRIVNVIPIFSLQLWLVSLCARSDRKNGGRVLCPIALMLLLEDRTESTMQCFSGTTMQHEDNESPGAANHFYERLPSALSFYYRSHHQPLAQL